MKTITKLDREFTLNKGYKICKDFMCLDIETSNNHAENIEDLITWVSSIQLLWGDDYYLFRTPEELCNFFNDVINKYNLIVRKEKDLIPKIYIFIHNASYDLSYLIPYFRELLEPHNLYEEETGFYEAMPLIDDQNSFISYSQGPLEFRCSYRLSNQSLEKWGNTMHVEHPKRVGLYDYSKIIYQDSELNENEQEYDKIDVVSLKECLIAQMDFHGDDLTTLPLTSTGYPRRELRESCLSEPKYKTEIFERSKMDAAIYNAALHAYAGGYTHNNRFLKDHIIRGDVRHRDFKSFYPSIMRVKMFPLGSWKKVYKNNMGILEISTILKESPEYSTLTHLRIYSATLRSSKITMPVLQVSKLVGKRINTLDDNGRVICFTSEDGVEGFFDNCTLKLINTQYELEYETLECYKCKNYPLPHHITEVIDKYFKGKSDKKNLVKKLIKELGETHLKTIEAQRDLMLTKALLNAIYGVTATNPIRAEWTLNIENETQRTACGESKQKQLDYFYAGRNNFLPYQIGVWVTAYAREELFEYIDVIGYENVIYCDTDSAFYISTPKIEAKIEELNALKRKTAPYVVLENGKKEYYDTFEEETAIKEFKGLHSKCYGYVNIHDEFVSTIAGVPSRVLIGMNGDKPIYRTREEELGNLDNLRDDFTFTTCTGFTACYVGAEGKYSERKPKIVEVNGHYVSTAGGCVIKPLEKKKVHENFFDFEKEKDLVSEILPNAEIYMEV